MNLKEIRHRILSVKSTQKITSAMKLVSSAKLRRTQSAVESMRPYQSKLDNMLRTTLAASHDAASKYASAREVKRVALIAVSSDTGLCGTFNSNISRLMTTVVEEYRSAGVEVEVYAVGKKMHSAVKKLGVTPCDSLMPQAGAPKYNEVANVAYSLIEQFLSGNIDKVELIYTRFDSLSRYTPVREQYLPVAFSDEASCAEAHACDYVIFEPGCEQLLNALLPRTIALHLYTSLLNSAVSEHAARMIAMQLATDNAEELIATLTLEYNKGRQQAITSEILDIVAGSAHEG